MFKSIQYATSDAFDAIKDSRLTSDLGVVATAAIHVVANELTIISDKSDYRLKVAKAVMANDDNFQADVDSIIAEQVADREDEEVRTSVRRAKRALKNAELIAKAEALKPKQAKPKQAKAK